MFGDISYRLKEKAITYKSKNCSMIQLQNYLVSVNKEVSQGYLYKDVCYRGTLQIEVITNTEILECNIEEEFVHMNNIIFEIFMKHLTDKFAEDLVKGKTDKVKQGFHINDIVVL